MVSTNPPPPSLRWPSLVPGPTIAVSVEERRALDEVLESLRFHGQDESAAQDHVWMEPPIPVRSAARNADIQHLRGLVTGEGPFPATCIVAGPLAYMSWSSALNIAIVGQKPKHARLLVEAGACVDGLPLWCFEKAAARYVRGRAKDVTISGYFQLEGIRKAFGGPRGQSHVAAAAQVRLGLTASELETRRATCSRFWTEADYPYLDFPATGPKSSLTEAAEAGDTDTYELLIHHGADESAWLQQVPDLRDPLSPSTLAALSPLHAAVAKQDLPMLKFLLGRHHKADIFPISTPTRALSPIMQSVTAKEPWHEGLMLMLPLCNLELRTPIFGVHLLHFAIASLDISLVDQIQAARTTTNDLFDIEPTALGHTVLHIACLPLEYACIKHDSAAVTKSAIELRNTVIDERNRDFRVQDNTGRPSHSRDQQIQGPSRGRGRGRGRGWGRSLLPPSRAERQATLVSEARRQCAMIRYILSKTVKPIAELSKQDMHGNTPLHYLAMMRAQDSYVELLVDLKMITEGKVIK